MAERRRERAMTVRMLDAETQMVSDLAERECVTVSEWIRNIIRREHLLAFGAKPRPKPKRKK